MKNRKSVMRRQIRSNIFFSTTHAPQMPIFGTKEISSLLVSLCLLLLLVACCFHQFVVVAFLLVVFIFSKVITYY